MRTTRLFSEVGKLLYAIAAADRKISDTEKKTLMNLTYRSISKFKERDRFGTPVLFYSEIEFEFLEEELIDPEVAISSFTDYIEEHYSAITLKEIELIREIAWEVACSFKNINKEENRMLNKMETAFHFIKNKHLKQIKDHENH
jgi:hypothetical protein